MLPCTSEFSLISSSSFQLSLSITGSATAAYFQKILVALSFIRHFNIRNHCYIKQRFLLSLLPLSLVPSSMTSSCSPFIKRGFSSTTFELSFVLHYVFSLSCHLPSPAVNSPCVLIGSTIIIFPPSIKTSSLFPLSVRLSPVLFILFFYSGLSHHISMMGSQIKCEKAAFQSDIFIIHVVFFCFFLPYQSIEEYFDINLISLELLQLSILIRAVINYFQHIC